MQFSQISSIRVIFRACCARYHDKRKKCSFSCISAVAVAAGIRTANLLHARRTLYPQRLPMGCEQQILEKVTKTKFIDTYRGKGFDRKNYI